MNTNTFFLSVNVQNDDNQKRFDKIIRKLLPNLPLSTVYRAIRKGAIRLNNQRVKAQAKVSAGDQINLSSQFKTHLDSFYTKSSDIRFNSEQQDLLTSLTLYENQDVIVLNKPRGFLTHGQCSLAHLVEKYWRSQNKSALSFRPGPVHRLDRNTTGIQLFALSVKGARILSSLFKQNRIQKMYIALVNGIVKKEQTWIDQIQRDSNRKKSFAAKSGAGLKALTHIIPVSVKDNMSCIICMPKTGRTHQIRLQAGLHNHSLVGDKKYGSTLLSIPYILHACAITIPTEYNSLQIPTVFAPLPQTSEDIFIRVLNINILNKAYKLVRSMIKNTVNCLKDKNTQNMPE